MQVETENHAVAKRKFYIYSLKTNNLGRSVPHKRPACPLKNNFVSWNYTLKAIFLVNLYYVEITLVTEKRRKKNKVRDKIAHLTIHKVQTKPIKDSCQKSHSTLPIKGCLCTYIANCKIILLALPRSIIIK